MKKFFKYTAVISAIVLVTSVVFLSSYALYKYVQGEEVTAYDRFYKKVDGKSVFNWYSLLFPVQTESQKIIRDTLAFDFKVAYPLAPKFEVVPPVDTTETERTVVRKLSALLADTLSKHKFDLRYDFDGQSLPVRDAHGIATPAVAKPHIFASLHGTASPEAGRKTFVSSIKPGVLEPGNAKVAQQRAERTATYLQQEIAALKISDKFSLDTITSEELQFSETDVVDSSTATMMLPEMRYACLHGFVPYERVEITPVTAPVTLPLWIALTSLLGLALLWLFARSPKSAAVVKHVEYVHVEEIQEEEQPSKRFNWGLLIALLVVFLILCIVIALIYYFWKLIVCVLIVLLILSLLSWLGDVLEKSYVATKTFFAKKQAYWSRKPVECKIVFGWFVISWLLIAIAAITYLLGYWHLCF